MGRHNLKFGAAIATLASLFAMASVAVAHADVFTFTSTGQSVGMTAPAGSHVLTYDEAGQTAPTPNGPGVAALSPVSGGGVTAVFSGNGGVVNGSVSDVNLAPQTGPSTQDTTNYLTVALNSGGSGSETVNITSGGPFKNLGLYWGSIDTYNTITFLGASGPIGTITGTDVLNKLFGNTSSSGNNANSQYIEFTDTTGQDITGITLSTDQAAFESDNLSVANGVPEPATWGMMLIGFGLVGLQLRRRTVKEVTC